MTALLQIINNPDKNYDKKVIELQNYLKDNSEIVINKELFTLTLLDRAPINGDFINKEGGKIVYPILHHCIEHDSAISEKKEKLSFQDVMKILDETVNRFITPQYFYKLINFQDQSSKNTLLHQAVISNNTEAIEALLKYGANPLIKNKEGNIPLDLAQGKTREVLIECMKDQAQLKKGNARCNSLIGIIPGVFLGVGGALIPSMTIILCALAVSALVAGIAVGVAIYFLSQDYKQAKAIEETVNPQSSLVNHAEASEIVGNTRS